jgi:hypothetical protein
LPVGTEQIHHYPSRARCAVRTERKVDSKRVSSRDDQGLGLLDERAWKIAHAGVRHLNVWQGP